eukprot:2947778-Pyramimonas_sp.AAC.1
MHLGVLGELQKAWDPPADTCGRILDGPRDAQSVDKPDELEDPTSLETSALEGFLVTVREGLARVGNSPGFSSRSDCVGPVARYTPGAAFKSYHGGHDELIRFDLRVKKLDMVQILRTPRVPAARPTPPAPPKGPARCGVDSSGPRSGRRAAR